MEFCLVGNWKPSSFAPQHKSSNPVRSTHVPTNTGTSQLGLGFDTQQESCQAKRFSAYGRRRKDITSGGSKHKTRSISEEVPLLLVIDVRTSF